MNEFATLTDEEISAAVEAQLDILFTEADEAIAAAQPFTMKES